LNINHNSEYAGKPVTIDTSCYLYILLISLRFCLIHTGIQEDVQRGARPKVFVTRPSFSPQPKHVLQIYALDEQSITKVIDDIQLIVRETIADTVLETAQDSESIKKLTDEQVVDH